MLPKITIILLLLLSFMSIVISGIKISPDTMSTALQLFSAGDVSDNPCPVLKVENIRQYMLPIMQQKYTQDTTELAFQLHTVAVFLGDLFPNKGLVGFLSSNALR